MSLDNLLKTFFEENPLAQKAAASIKDKREIALAVTSGDQTQAYTFTKDSGKNVLTAGNAPSPDLTFTMPEAAAQELATKRFDSVGQVGLFIFEKMLSHDPQQKIKAKINVGFLALMTGGYLGVLTAGGSDVAKFLATKGLGNMGKLKDAISKLKAGS